MGISGLGVEGGVASHDSLTAHEGGEAFNRRLKELHDAKKAHEVALQELDLGKAARKAYNEAFAQVSESKEVLHAARNEAAGFIPKAKAEAAQIIASSKEQAAKIKEQAEAVLAQAKEEAKRFLSDAYIELEVKRSAAIRDELRKLEAMKAEAEKAKDLHEGIVKRIKAAIDG